MERVTKPVEQTAVVAVAERNVAAELLRVVSERTGYSKDMLRIDADFEADFGIDAITRIDILSTFIGTFSAEELEILSADISTLVRARTLREIVTAVKAALGHTSAETADRSRSQNEVEMVRKATEVLGTTHVTRWMRSKIPSLGDQTPYALIQTEDGRRQVERVLLKIEHGVY